MSKLQPNWPAHESALAFVLKEDDKVVVTTKALSTVAQASVSPTGALDSQVASLEKQIISDQLGRIFYSTINDPLWAC